MKNKGFSFVELLVAVAILGIISLPIVSSFALAAKTDAKATHLSAMNDAADDVMLLLDAVKSGSEFDSDSVDPIDRLLCEFKEYFKSVAPEADQSESELESQHTPIECKYNGYSVKITLKYVSHNYYRADIIVTHSISGQTLEVQRKGLLSYA